MPGLKPTKIPYGTKRWDPARGCTMHCEYCFHRLRVAPRMARFCAKCGRHEVHQHPELLDGPAKMRKPQVVLVCFGGDLFDAARPGRDIQQVIDAAKAAPQHTYVFLTKNPGRAWIWTDEFKRHGNWWMGITVEGQELVRVRVPLWAGDGMNLWLSVEPQRSAIRYDHLPSVPKWIVVGCDSRRGEDRYPWDDDWARQADVFCTANKIPLFVKQIRTADGTLVRERRRFPKDLRFQETPWAMSGKRGR